MAYKRKTASKRGSAPLPEAVWHGFMMQGLMSYFYDDTDVQTTAFLATVGGEESATSAVKSGKPAAAFQAGRTFAKYLREAYQASLLPDFENAVAGGDPLARGLDKTVNALTDAMSNPMDAAMDISGLSMDSDSGALDLVMSALGQ